MTVSREWLDFVVAEAEKLPPDVEERRMELKNTMRRIQKEYLALRLDEAEYLALRREHEAELGLLPAHRPELITAAKQMEAFGELWETASPQARNQTCRLVLARVVLNVRERQVVEVTPYPEFEPLFQLRRSLYVRQTQRGLDATNVNSAPRHYTLEELGVAV